MSEKFIKILQDTGLNDKEAKIYLAILELGKAKVSEIVKLAKLKRTTGYEILDSLEVKKLVAYSHSGQVRYYYAQHPKILSETLADKKETLDRALPNLEKIYATQTIRPAMKFYEGEKGIKEIYRETLKCQNKKILQVVSVKSFLEFPGRQFLQWYIRERVKRGIMAIALHPKSGDIYDKNFGRTDLKLKREIRYLPPSVFFVSMMMIYDNKVAMMSTKKENFGFILESKEFSDTLRAWFDFMWKLGSKEYEK